MCDIYDLIKEINWLAKRALTGELDGYFYARGIYECGHRCIHHTFPCEKYEWVACLTGLRELKMVVLVKRKC